MTKFNVGDVRHDSMHIYLIVDIMCYPDDDDDVLKCLMLDSGNSGIFCTGQMINWPCWACEDPLLCIGE